jgi:AbrB family looped-hinge helix DNA binding protein
MNATTSLSAKGQIVIPKDVREELGWLEGQRLEVRRTGSGVLLTPTQTARPRISWEEFRYRIPRHDGPPLSIEDMDAAVERMFRERYRSDA